MGQKTGPGARFTKVPCLPNCAKNHGVMHIIAVTAFAKSKGKQSLFRAGYVTPKVRFLNDPKFPVGLSRAYPPPSFAPATAL